MDYTSWTLDELEQMSAYLAARGVGAEERAAVLREIRRREQPVPRTSTALATTASSGTSPKQGVAGTERVGVARRFVAVLIDGVIFFLLGLLLALITGGAYASSTDGTHTAGFHLGGGGVLVVALLVFVYYVSCEALFGGTVGKLALGLRVVNEDGDPITWGASIVRNLVRIVDGLFFYLVGAIAIWSSPARQRLGDRAAHTYVVHT